MPVESWHGILLTAFTCAETREKACSRQSQSDISPRWLRGWARWHDLSVRGTVSLHHHARPAQPAHPDHGGNPRRSKLFLWFDVCRTGHDILKASSSALDLLGAMPKLASQQLVLAAGCNGEGTRNAGVGQASAAQNPHQSVKHLRWKSENRLLKGCLANLGPSFE
jgi:hypothetical protein